MIDLQVKKCVSHNGWIRIVHLLLERLLFASFFRLSLLLLLLTVNFSTLLLPILAEEEKQQEKGNDIFPSWLSSSTSSSRRRQRKTTTSVCHSLQSDDDDGGNINNNYCNFIDDSDDYLLWSEILSINEGKGLSPSQKETDDLGQELVFGELSFEGINRLVSIMEEIKHDGNDDNNNNNNDDVFLDLGSGTGTVTLMVAYKLSPHQVQNSIGIEYAFGRHQVALKRLQYITTSSFLFNYHANNKENNDNNNNKQLEKEESSTNRKNIVSSEEEEEIVVVDKNRVNFLNGNFLDLDEFGSYYKNVTIIFCNSLAFSDGTNQALKELFSNRQHMPKVRLVISGFYFDTAQDCYRQHFDVSWGSTTFTLWVCHF